MAFCVNFLLFYALSCVKSCVRFYKIMNHINLLFYRHLSDIQQTYDFFILTNLLYEISFQVLFSISSNLFFSKNLIIFFGGRATANINIDFKIMWHYNICRKKESAKNTFFFLGVPRISLL